VESFSRDGICCDASRSGPKHQILLSVHGSKLLEPSTGGEDSFSLSCTSLSINLKEELRRLWLIDCKFSSVLIYHSIINLPLFRIEVPWRQICGYSLVNWMFSLESI
jgi:hypothetical protein